MSPAELEALLLGLLRLWRVKAEVSVGRVDDTVQATITFPDRGAIGVSWAEAPFGIIWQVQADGRRQRTYPSVGGLIRDLRERLVPERGSARVLFAGVAGR